MLTYFSANYLGKLLRQKQHTVVDDHRRQWRQFFKHRLYGTSSWQSDMFKHRVSMLPCIPVHRSQEQWLKLCIDSSLSEKHTAQLQSITCHARSHSVTCHPKYMNVPHLNTRQTGQHLIYLYLKDKRST